MSLDDKPAKLLAALGTFSIAWSTLEMALDFSVSIVFYQYDGKGIARKLPRRLSEKTKFLHNCASRSVSLANFTSRINDVLTRVGELTEFRHQITHGAVTASDPGQSITLVRLVFGAASFQQMKTQIVSLEELLVASNKTRIAAHDILGIALELGKLAAPPGFDDVEKTLSNLRM